MGWGGCSLTFLRGWEGSGGVHAVSLQDYPFSSSSVELEVNRVSKGSSLVVINKTALIDSLVVINKTALID